MSGPAGGGGRLCRPLSRGPSGRPDACGRDDHRPPPALNGKKVCSTRGSTPGKYLQNQVAPQVQIVENDSYERCLTALTSNEVDGVTTDDAILAGYAAQNPGKYRLGGFRLSNEEYGIGLPKDSHRKSAVQAALDKMTREGDWKKAVQEHLPLLQRETPQS